jgi:hypothetical protein
MEYTEFFQTTLENLGLDVHGVWNAYDTPHHAQSGWPLKLPTVEFGPKTVLLMHFQDFVTFDQHKIVELEQLEQFYGSRADQILVTHMQHGLEKVYHGPIKLIEYSNHNCREMTRLSARWHQCESVLHQTRTHAWQCLNGRMCPHRRRAVSVLQSWPNGWLSYGPEIKLPQWAYDTYRGTENDENFVRLLPVYGSASVNIVTETLYDHRPGLISEKTLFAMAAGQIPIIIGSAGIVADCKNMGFDVFDDVVDTSYDFLPNDQRVEQALLRNQDLIQGRIPLHNLHQRLSQQSQYVRNHLTDWYQNNFVQQATRLFSSMT